MRRRQLQRLQIGVDRQELDAGGPVGLDHPVDGIDTGSADTPTTRRTGRADAGGRRRTARSRHPAPVRCGRRRPGELVFPAGRRAQRAGRRLSPISAMLGARTRWRSRSLGRRAPPASSSSEGRLQRRGLVQRRMWRRACGGAVRLSACRRGCRAPAPAPAAATGSRLLRGGGSRLDGSSSAVLRNSCRASGPSRMLARLPVAMGKDLLGELPVGMCAARPSGSYLSTDMPLTGASAKRTVLAGYATRTPGRRSSPRGSRSPPWRAMCARSTKVGRMPSISTSGLRFSLIMASVFCSWIRPRMDRYSHWTGTITLSRCRQRVDREQPEARRSVDEDEVVVVLDLLQRASAAERSRPIIEAIAISAPARSIEAQATSISRLRTTSRIDMLVDQHVVHRRLERVGVDALGHGQVALGVHVGSTARGGLLRQTPPRGSAWSSSWRRRPSDWRVRSPWSSSVPPQSVPMVRGDHTRHVFADIGTVNPSSRAGSVRRML